MFKIFAFLVFGTLIIAYCNASVDNEREHHAKARHYHHRNKQENHHKIHKEKQYQHHHLGKSSHHKQFKQRSSNQSGCSWFCYEQQLWSVIAIFNGTRELDILYNILPKPIRIYAGTNSTNGSCPPVSPNNTSPSNSTGGTTVLPGNGTCRNSSGPEQWISPFKNSTLPYPIFSHLLKAFVEFLADPRGIKYLFNSTTVFSGLWKEVVTHINFINRTNILSQNLNTLFGSNGSLGANIFNLSYTEHLISNISAGGFIRGIEQGVESLLNVSGFYRAGQNLSVQHSLV